ncbi:MAG: DUF11 domain-containing protein [Actinobacteria bacterium]|nr:DUF11 domain-containing protein [Actinomycetota bacterium]
MNRSADLKVTKTASPSPATIGDQITYTIVVSDVGPSDAEGVQVTDTLPARLSGAVYCIGVACTPAASWAGSASLGTISAGSSKTLIITATVDPVNPIAATMNNTVSVTAATTLINTGDDSAMATTTVNRRVTDLVFTSLSDTSAQYSDPAALDAMLTDHETGAPIGAGGVSFALGSQSAATSTDSAGHARVTIVLTQAAGTPGVFAAFPGDFVYAPANASGPFEIKKESVGISYTGDSLVSTGSSSTSSTASVNLAAVVTEEADGSLGNQLTGKQVKFSLYKSSNSTMTTADYTCIATLGAEASGQATGTCLLSALPIDAYNIKIELLSNNYYLGPEGTGTVTVVQTGSGMTNGGGWLTEPNLGTKSNLGFTVKYLKNGNVQGSSVYVYRQTRDIGGLCSGCPTGARTYDFIIKSNAMGALTQSCTTTTPVVCKSTFTGKATWSAVDVTTGTVYGLGGGYQFQVDVTDNGEPGSKPAPIPDTYAQRMWTSSNPAVYQVGTPSSQIPLGGGNIQIKP